MRQELTTEEICRKLRPVFGKRIDVVYLKYRLSDSFEKKREIEQGLNALYHKYLSDNLLNEKILLEPPQSELISGEYPLATVTYADRDLYTFGLREKEWPRHVCISGMSGAGKTTFAFQILGNFIKHNKPFLAFDWKKSFRPLMLVKNDIFCFTIGNPSVSNLFKININKPPKGVMPKEWLNILCDLINESFFASYGVHKILSETLDRAFREFGVYEGSENYPTWFQIKDRLNDMDDKSVHGRESEWLTSAQRIAHALTFGSFGESVNYKGEAAMTVEELLDKQAIFELNSLNNMEKKFFCEFILTYIYKYKKGNQMDAGNEFKHAILVDEAHNIFLKDKPHFANETVTEMVYRELREYGVSLICLDQHISKLSDVVAGNSACNIAFQQVLPQDVECISGLMQLRDKKQYFSMLPVGTAIVKLAERFHTPFMVKAPQITLKDQMVTDSLVAERMKSLVGTRKKIELFRQSCDEERLQRKVLQLDTVFRKSGVDVEDGYSKIYVKPKLANHFQKKIADRVMTGAATKEDMLKEGYRTTDVHKAFKYAESKKFKEELRDEEKDFLKFVQDHKNCNTSEVYKGMNVSFRKGNSLKNCLLVKGFIAIDEVRDTTGWRKIIRIA